MSCGGFRLFRILHQTKRNTSRGIFILAGNSGGGEIRINLFGSVPLPGEPGTIEIELEAPAEEDEDALKIEDGAIKRKKRGKK